MCSGQRGDDDGRVRVPRPVALASACLGLTVIAEVGAVVLPWGLNSSYDSLFFALYKVTLAAVGVLIVRQQARRPVGWFPVPVRCAGRGDCGSGDRVGSARRRGGLDRR